MSSLRRAPKNAQRIHWERAQPEHRKSLGQLEKKKDYKKRAKDFQKKRDELTELRRKAADKNPDEFYFHMINSTTKDGVHFEKPKDVDTEVQKKLMHERDAKYVQYKLNVENKKIEKLRGELNLVDAEIACSASNKSGKPKHIVFVDTDEEARQFNPVTYLNTRPELLTRRYNRPREETLKSAPVSGCVSAEDVLQTEKVRKKRYKELLKRLERQKQLQIVLDKLLVRKHLQNEKDRTGKLRPKKLRSGTADSAPVYRFGYKRKR